MYKYNPDTDMIITKESDIFQKLIKDVEHIKDALKMGRHYFESDGYNCEEKGRWYEKGEWVVRTVDKDDPDHRKGKIFKVMDATGSLTHESTAISHWASSLRPATKEEIKSHLIEGAIHKHGLVAYRKFQWDEEASYMSPSTILPGGGFEYLPEIDTLTVAIAEADVRRAIYSNGRWATVVYDKKKLPKTKDEFNIFLGKWANRHCKSVEEFLNDYEE